MDLSKVDRIELTMDDAQKVLVWDRENYKKCEGQFALEEAVVCIITELIGQRMEHRTYYKVDGDCLHVKIMVDDRVFVSFEMDSDFVTSGFRTNHIDKSFDAIKLGGSMDDVYEQQRMAVLMITGINRYMTYFDGTEYITNTVERKQITKKAKGGQGKSRRVVKLVKRHILNVPENLEISTEFKPTKTRQRHVDGWMVRGHYRHYKSGKVSWIPPYAKGDVKNIASKTYKIT